MDRAEAAGLGVATLGHVALLVALSVGFAATRLPVTKSDPIEVSFVDEVGLESTSPTPLAVEPAPLAGPENGPPLQAMPTPPEMQPVPVPQAQPQPRLQLSAVTPKPAAAPRPQPPIQQPQAGRQPHGRKQTRLRAGLRRLEQGLPAWHPR